MKMLVPIVLAISGIVLGVLTVYGVMWSAFLDNGHAWLAYNWGILPVTALLAGLAVYRGVSRLVDNVQFSWGNYFLYLVIPSALSAAAYMYYLRNFT